MFALAKSGRAHMLLKASSKRRPKKEEIVQKQRVEEEEKKHIVELKTTEEILKQNNYKIADIPHIAKQNQEMLNYLKAKGLVDESGNVKQ